MKKADIQKLCVALMFVLPVMASATINPKNGNFYITYLDVSLKRDGHALEIRRTYNSMSVDMGWFGYGWGSPFETRLIVLPDGSAVVKENGNGRETFYRTPYDNTEKIKLEVRRIVDAATQREKLGQDAAEKLTSDLARDETMRMRQVIKYGMVSELPMDAALDDSCGKGSLLRVKQGYLRRECGQYGEAAPHTDSFDLKGRLTQRQFADGYGVFINYDEHVPRSSIRDSNGQRINLLWTHGGTVMEASTDKTSTTYAYNERGDLIQSDGEIGNNYRYTYDSNHNLTRIAYEDGSDMVVTYAPVSSYATSQKDRNGSSETFDYGTDPADKNHYWTQVTSKDVDGNVTTKKYEFSYNISETGVEREASIVRPDRSGEHQLTYDDKGRLVRRTNRDGSFTDYIYDPHGNNLLLVIADKRRTEYHYNQQDNLTQIQNSYGEVTSLSYNNQQQIDRIVIEPGRNGGQRRELAFKYNVNGKPVEINMIGTGRILLQYDAQSAVVGVTSKQGGKVAKKIADVFEKYMGQITAAKPLP
jgi:YD repeat-containing protein